MHAIDLMNNSVVDVSFFLFSLMFNQNIITEPSSETTDFSLVTHAGLFQSFSPFNIVHLPLLLSATSQRDAYNHVSPTFFCPNILLHLVVYHNIGENAVFAANSVSMWLTSFSLIVLTYLKGPLTWGYFIIL